MEKGKTDAITNVGIPSGLADLIDLLRSFPQLGIVSRNAFVTAATQLHADASIKKLIELRDLGMLDAEDLDRLKSWMRKR